MDLSDVNGIPNLIQNYAAELWRSVTPLSGNLPAWIRKIIARSKTQAIANKLSDSQRLQIIALCAIRAEKTWKPLQEPLKLNRRPGVDIKQLVADQGDED